MSKGKCTIAVGFTPSALGARSATLALHDNAGTRRVQHVAVSGTGLADVVVSPRQHRLRQGEVERDEEQDGDGGERAAGRRWR